MTKTLLVLAASRYQLDTIITAKKLGYRVITTDNNRLNPGHALADRAYSEDTTDIDAVLAIAKNEQIDGIIAPCTDVAVLTAASVAEALGLPGPPVNAAKIVTNKAYFREFLAQHHDLHPQFHVLDHNQMVSLELFSSDKVWVMKPDFSSGSKGIFIIRNQLAFNLHLEETRSFSPTGRIILEEFIDGHQGTIEGFLQEGEVISCFFLDRQTAPEPYVTTIGHYVPTLLPEFVQSHAISELKKIFNILGIKDGVFDCDFVWTSEDLFILEVTPRLGGNSISNLIRFSSGVDLVQLAIQFACGDKIELPEQNEIKPAAVVLLGVWNAGKLQIDMTAYQYILSQPWVESISFDIETGENVQPFTSGRHRIGESIVTAVCREEIPCRVDLLYKLLSIKVL